MFPLAAAVDAGGGAEVAAALVCALTLQTMDEVTAAAEVVVTAATDEVVTSATEEVAASTDVATDEDVSPAARAPTLVVAAGAIDTVMAVAWIVASVVTKLAPIPDAAALF